ncbi:MAG: hypothetical protein HKM95_08475 [Inquilinus sp.]|nr:hypothetical protein [Inquilinus sp.]
MATFVETLRDGNVRERYRAALCLGAMGAAAGEAVPALIDAVHDGAQVETLEYDYFSFSTVGEAAIEALGHIGTAAALPLLSLQGDADPAIRSAAFEALSRIHTDAEAGAPFFSQALDSRLPQERLAAVRLIGGYLPAARGVVADLERAMGDTDSGVRAAAARALGRIAQEDLPVAVPLLIDALADDDDAVREASVIAFRSFHRRYQHNERIAEIGPDQVDILSASIASDSPEIRRRALWIVKAIGPSAEGAMPAVIAALDDQDVRVRSAAIRALYRFPEHTRRASPILLELLTDPRTSRHVSIVLYENGVDVRQAVPALTGALAHPSPEVRWNAAHVIRRLGSNAHAAGEALIGLLSDEESSVRFHAARALQRVPANPTHAVPALMRLMAESDAQTRTEIAQALGQFGRGALAAAPLLTEALGDDRDNLRHMAAWALGQIGFDRNLVRDLAGFFGSEGHRAFAISEDGQSWGWSAGNDHGDEAVSRAVADCQQAATGTCRVYAVDDDVLWSDDEWRALMR